MLILRYINDVWNCPGTNPNEPIYVIEIGAGHGRLGFLIVQWLMELRDLLPPSAVVPFCYVLTDFTPESVAWWRQHPMLREFIEQGTLDLAVVDVESFDGSLKLECSGRVVNSQTATNPPFFVLNGVVSSIRQEVYRVHRDSIMKARISVLLDEEKADATSFRIIPKLRWAIGTSVVNGG